MKSNSATSFILTAIVLAFLYVSNPKEHEFQQYVKANLMTEAVEQGGLLGALKELFAGPEAWVTKVNTHRTNYYFFSIYEVNGLKSNRRYIGVFANFIELPN